MRLPICCGISAKSICRAVARSGMRRRSATGLAWSTPQFAPTTMQPLPRPARMSSTRPWVAASCSWRRQLRMATPSSSSQWKSWASSSSEKTPPVMRSSSSSTPTRPSRSLMGSATALLSVWNSRLISRFARTSALSARRMRPCCARCRPIPVERLSGKCSTRAGSWPVMCAGRSQWSSEEGAPSVGSALGLRRKMTTRFTQSASRSCWTASERSSRTSRLWTRRDEKRRSSSSPRRGA